MSSLKVLWLTSDYPSEADPVAGVFFRTQARALVRAGIDVEVVAPVPYAPAAIGRLAGRWKRYRETPNNYLDEGVVVKRPRYLATPQQNLYGLPHIMLAEALRRAAGKSGWDLVHAHYAYPEGLAGLRVARLARKPFVVTLHGDDGNTYPDRGPIARRRFERVVGAADRVLAVSRALAQVTEHRTGVRPEVQHIGVDLRGFEGLPSRSEAREALGIAPTAFMILFVGYLLETKGIRELIAAVQEPDLADAVTWVVGDGPLRPSLESIPRVSCAGAVSNDRVRLFLRAADVLALPSYGEGTPTVVVEAGAAGVPVVATAVGGTVALLAEERGILVPPRDARALAHALSTVRADPVSSQRRAEALGRLVAEEHDADRLGRRLRDVYMGLVGRRSVPGVGSDEVDGRCAV